MRAVVMCVNSRSHYRCDLFGCVLAAFVWVKAIYDTPWFESICVSLCVCVCMLVCVYVCIFVCVCVFTAVDQSQFGADREPN